MKMFTAYARTIQALFDRAADESLCGRRWECFRLRGLAVLMAAPVALVVWLALNAFPLP